MKRDDLIPWHWTWDAAGKLIRVLYRTPEEHRRINLGLPFRDGGILDLPAKPQPDLPGEVRITRGIHAGRKIQPSLL